MYKHSGEGKVPGREFTWEHHSTAWWPLQATTLSDCQTRGFPRGQVMSGYTYGLIGVDREKVWEVNPNKRVTLCPTNLSLLQGHAVCPNLKGQTDLQIPRGVQQATPAAVGPNLSDCPPARVVILANLTDHGKAGRKSVR